MKRNTLTVVSLLCAVFVLADPACAQRGGGPRGGGGGGGGRGAGQGGSGAGGAAGAGPGGGICAGRDGSGMGPGESQANGGMMNFLAGAARGQGPQRGPGMMQRQGNQSFQSNMATAGRNRPSATQFAQAALRFDRNGDAELDSDELALVARAVMAELRTQQPARFSPAAGMGMPSDRPGSAQSAAPEMTTAFVRKALTFDRDQSGTLNVSETRVLAAAFIRTLGS